MFVYMYRVNAAAWWTDRRHLNIDCIWIEHFKYREVWCLHGERHKRVNVRKHDNIMLFVWRKQKVQYLWYAWVAGILVILPNNTRD